MIIRAYQFFLEDRAGDPEAAGRTREMVSSVSGLLIARFSASGETTRHKNLPTRCRCRAKR
ncbi:hypothetical protein JG687_00016140 [Phytophthora cactorum]|uniref:Uncharacterized protein n=1 Tax=Phytophthora cactorum TaxID=29920 RepID=A0A8T1TRU2_9STRA|nr:hypothetical protein JG687_00016140 [Phytophthora cactorum]